MTRSGFGLRNKVLSVSGSGSGQKDPDPKLKLVSPQKYVERFLSPTIIVATGIAAAVNLVEKMGVSLATKGEIKGNIATKSKIRVKIVTKSKAKVKIATKSKVMVKIATKSPGQNSNQK